MTPNIKWFKLSNLAPCSTMEQWSAGASGANHSPRHCEVVSADADMYEATSRTTGCHIALI